MGFKLKTRTAFPALVTVQTPILLVKNGISYDFSIDVDLLVPQILTTPILVRGTDTVGGGTRYFRANGSDFTEVYKSSSGLGTTADPLNFYTNTLAANAASLGRDGLWVVAGGMLSLNATQGVGYGTGAGGAVTQITSRTTGVTLNKATGAITLFNAAGSATAASFTVTNSAVVATDCVVVSVKSSTTNKYNAFVTAVGAGSFEITFNTTGGTTVDSPVFNFAVIKAVAT